LIRQNKPGLIWYVKKTTPPDFFLARDTQARTPTDDPHRYAARNPFSFFDSMAAAGVQDGGDRASSVKKPVVAQQVRIQPAYPFSVLPPPSPPSQQRTSWSSAPMLADPPPGARHSPSSSQFPTLPPVSAVPVRGRRQETRPTVPSLARLLCSVLSLDPRGQYVRAQPLARPTSPP
jgi:hypothetical protein